MMIEIMFIYIYNTLTPELDRQELSEKNYLVNVYTVIRGVSTRESQTQLLRHFSFINKSTKIRSSTEV